MKNQTAKTIKKIYTSSFRYAGFFWPQIEHIKANGWVVDTEQGHLYPYPYLLHTFCKHRFCFFFYDMSPSKQPRLTKGSKAVRLLRAKFESGWLTGDERAQDVYASDPAFQAHKADNFWTCYNNMRREFRSADGTVCRTCFT